jgi:hypothetical protein
VVACEPLAVDSDLRTPSPPDGGLSDAWDGGRDPGTPPPLLSTCELSGFACASRTQLLAQLGSPTCPAGLYEEQQPCDTRADFSSEWLCCGTIDPNLPIPDACSLGGFFCTRPETETSTTCPQPLRTVGLACTPERQTMIPLVCCSP